MVVLSTLTWSMQVQARCNMGDAKWKVKISNDIYGDLSEFVGISSGQTA